MINTRTTDDYRKTQFQVFSTREMDLFENQSSLEYS